MSDNHGGLYNLINAHEKRIASLVVEVVLKDKEIRKWKEAWQQADDEAAQNQKHQVFYPAAIFESRHRRMQKHQ